MARRVRVRLITLVGRHVDVLPSMLAHYHALGIDTFAVNVHLRRPDDSILDRVRHITAQYGHDVASTTIGDWQSRQEGVWRASMQSRPDDWCVLADQDELHRYPDDLRSLLAYCDRRGYDYLCGAFVDRLSADGSFPAIDPTRPIGEQFPLGAFLSYPLLHADPRKVVAARGRIPIIRGQHGALRGVGCPIEKVFAQVHHFKWTAGLVDRLRERATLLRAHRITHWTESDRFVEYFRTHAGRIDLSDRRFLVAPCEPEYRPWPRIVAMVRAHRDAPA